LFDLRRLRHRQDIELERAGHRSFEIMGLIWLGILGLLLAALSRP
jgi:hypothetical protein